MSRTRYEKWLLQITDLPTAAGHEDRVEAWIEDWVARRPTLRLRRDTDGNLIITRKGRLPRRPIFITAHLDHPAFVIAAIDGRDLEFEFRGGVHEPYFEDARIELFDAADERHTARIDAVDMQARPFKRVTARLSRSNSTLVPGDIGRWALRGAGATSVIRSGQLLAPACDDLAAVAAALSAMDALSRRPDAGQVGLLFTRAEEIGFVGAIGACKLRSVPDDARLICLENSRSFPESPIGGGPIVRVGDRMSVFGPTLTNRISLLMERHAARRPGFRWQRKLMPGGTCEATAFSLFGYESTCICLPLGNYHNMRDIDAVQAGARPARVGPEVIAVDDYHGMIELLTICASGLDDDSVEGLEARMERLYDQHSFVLE